jgi:hypothetical protein
MIRAKFKTSPEDFHPVTFNHPHPFWRVGFMHDGSSVIIAYADDREQILDFWPDADEIDAEQAQSYCFNKRFPRPTWFKK